MPFRILHVLSSDFYTGSVAYALKLAESQMQLGHEVFMVTDNGKLTDVFQCIELPISNRSFRQRIKNIWFLRKTLRNLNINVIHGHSRAASWVIYYASIGLNIPIVSTIHGRRKKKRNDIYGDRIITICPNLVDHLIKEMKYNAQKIVSIPNGIDPGYLLQARSRFDEKFVVSIISRFNGSKGQKIITLLSDVFPTLLNEFPHLYLQLNGDGWSGFPKEGKNAYEQLHATYNERVQYLGFKNEILNTMVNSDMVIGAGRVALESLFLKTPVMAMGEACYHGILNEENIHEAIASNFGDILPHHTEFIPNATQMKEDLRKFIRQGGHQDLSRYLEKYKSGQVTSEIIKVYEAVASKKKQ